MSGETWLDVIPAIPLARGVPVVGPKGKPGTVIEVGEDGVPIVGYTTNHGTSDIKRNQRARTAGWHPAQCRPDLDDHQGFGFALRAYLPRARSPKRSPAPNWLAIIHRHIHGETSDDDRQALARALREVANAL